jgi:3-oxoacyl-[acyl-carrier protein] reductase
VTSALPFEGRVALVTGGTRGIGRAISLALALGGADVAMTYRRDGDAAEETVGTVKWMGRRVVALQAPVQTGAEADAVVAEVTDALGEVDILVNNAGIASRGLTVADTDPAEVEKVLGAHTIAAFHLCRATLPAMRTKHRGDIVMISSTATTFMPANGAPYNMAKAALEALARTLAKEEAGNGIHVNVVAPGLVDTEMGRRLVKGRMGIDDIHQLAPTSPFGRVCSPEDVADVVVWLASDGARYVNGQVIYVDGGLTS